jgi:alpha-glucoside transport system substrate-binding protein
MMFTRSGTRGLTTRSHDDRKRSRSKRRVLLTAAASASLLAAACSSGSKGAQAAPTLTGDCAQFQAYAGHSGTTVTMFASIISPESDSLQKSWAKFSQCTGIKISYEGSNDFESQLAVRVSGGNAPDLAVIPQPGLLAQMVKTH